MSVAAAGVRAMTPDALAKFIARHRFTHVNERQLQAQLARTIGTLARSACVAREVEVAPGDRIDFVVGRIGVEVKIAGSLAVVTRQLHRYAQSQALDGLVLVTTRAAHRRVPTTLQGKPCRVAYLSPL